MRTAFEQLGYQVDFIHGNAAQRKLLMEEVKKTIRQGVKYEFMYAECSTEPTLLTEPHHLPLHPFLDFSFFRFCKSHGIRIGLFYRDVYWNFPFYGDTLPFWKKAMAKAFYRYDLRKYNQLLDVLYLPSRRMLDHVPHKMKMKVEELPPGADFDNQGQNGLQPEHRTISGIHILYVGGVSGIYRIHALWAAVKERPQVQLTVCCRKEEWEKSHSDYQQYISPNIAVVHKSGEELKELYERANLVSLFMEPNEYRNFAFPVKLFEYIRFGKAVIATDNTAVGEFVQKYDIGWVIPYEVSRLLQLLDELLKDPVLISEKTGKIKEILNDNSWNARAKKVVEDLRV